MNGTNRKDGAGGVDRLWDSQWVNIVNAPQVLNAESQEDAVNIAVRMTEQKMAENARLRESAGGDPIDANDNADYIEHCADRLERLGHRVIAGALRVIAIEDRAQQPASVDGVKGYPLWEAIHAESAKAGQPCNVGLAQVIAALDALAAQPQGGRDE